MIPPAPRKCILPGAGARVAKVQGTSRVGLPTTGGAAGAAGSGNAGVAAFVVATFSGSVTGDTGSACTKVLIPNATAVSQNIFLFIALSSC